MSLSHNLIQDNQGTSTEDTVIETVKMEPAKFPARILASIPA